jgi:DNA-binding protein HU-beta
VNKRQLVERIATATDLSTSEVAAVIDTFIAVVTEGVSRGEKVVLSGFGTFLRKQRARRTGRDIGAERAVSVPATTVPSFRPGKPFREIVARRRRSRPRTG